MRLLLVGLNVDGTDLGESLSAFKLAQALSLQVDTTLLCMQWPGRKPVSEQLPHARVVTWLEPEWLMKLGRVRAMAKTSWPILCRHARRWIREAEQRGEYFDFAHQIVPQQMRNATPLRHTNIPYAIGPVGGSLSTPESFKDELEPRSLLVKLRGLDQLRFRYDPGIRKTFSKAELVIGVAPYVRDVLKDIPIKRFESLLEFSYDGLAPINRRSTKLGQLKLLHVGRGVRTKGLRDVIRAMALLKDLPEVTLTSAGEGSETDICREEAKRLGIEDRVKFLGLIPRSEVEQLYATHDVFAFPTFREPMGGVFFEAMRWGLPVITADRGGPQAIINASCGYKIAVEAPAQFSRDIAQAIRELASDPDLVRRLGEGSVTRLQGFGSWDDKATHLIKRYGEILKDLPQR